MNKWLLGVAMLLSSLFSYAQSPQAMNFQAVARNTGGNPLSDKEVGIKIEIVQGSASGTTVYGETHQATTTKNGVVNLQIGNGTAINGIFTEIDWSQSPYFLRISMDTDGGSNYKEMSTSQMLSVPYALYAERAGTAGGETEKKHDFWVLPNDRPSSEILTGKELPFYGRASFFAKYLDEIDQEVTMEFKGLPSGVSFYDGSSESGPFGRYLRPDGFKSEGSIPAGHYPCTIIFKNKYGVTKSYPFIYEVSEQLPPNTSTGTDENIHAFLTGITDSYQEIKTQIESIDNAFMDKSTNDATNGEYAVFKSKTYNTFTPQLYSLWAGCYQCIHRCNSLVEALFRETSPEASENMKINAIKQGKAIRAYAHLTLTTWFERVPLVLNTFESSGIINPYQSERPEILDAVISDFAEAQDVTPLLKDGEITAKEIRILLHEAQLLKGDWQTVSTIQPQDGIFAFIKKIADWKLNPTKTITEASLMEEYMNNYHSSYKRGNLYLNVLNYSAEYFQMKTYKALLPIPQREIDLNPNLIQNGGY